MHKIAILSSSVRDNRGSHRVALFFQKYLEKYKLADVDMLDLKAFDFPLFEERLRYMKEPSDLVKEFAERIERADGIIIISPEYNGGIPASLKNVIDLLYDEWRKKPLAIATVSAGAFGGTQVITSLLFTLWKIGAWVVPAAYHVPTVTKAYEEDGTPVEKEATEKRALKFIQELMWTIRAYKKMEAE